MFKFLSGTFLMIGAVVGGGILAIPIVSAKFGFLITLILIVLAWAIMTKTGLYVLELCLSCPEKYNSYYSIVGKYLGHRVQKITILFFLWLLYLSLASYISGCVSVIMSHMPNTSTFFSYFNLSVAYVLVFGTLLAISAKIIVRLNVFIVLLKLGLLALVISTASNFSHLEHFNDVNVKYTGLFSLFLIIINAFGFQFIVPSLVSYYGAFQAKMFKRMLISSTTTVLFLYLAWLYTIYSIIPLQGEHGLVSIYESKNQLLAFNDSLKHFLHAEWITQLLSLFEAVALFGSFFCVSLGVFDFLADIFKARGRVLIAFCTFSPPLLLTIMSQNMYIYAMSASGYIAVILEIIIPIWAIKVAASHHFLKQQPAQGRFFHEGFPN